MSQYSSDTLAAVILCGGQSRRMGSDKGLLAPQGIPWITTLHEVLSSLSLPVYVSVRADQQETYEPMLPAAQWVIDQPWEHIAGPLVGILSVAHALPNTHLLVVPCDMPKLRESVIERWLDAFQARETSYQAFISQTARRWQPLCGIYHARGLQALMEYYHQGTLKDQSMHAILDQWLTTYPIEIPEALTEQFANYNTPEDLADE